MEKKFLQNKTYPQTVTEHVFSTKIELFIYAIRICHQKWIVGEVWDRKCFESVPFTLGDLIEEYTFIKFKYITRVYKDCFLY